MIHKLSAPQAQALIGPTFEPMNENVFTHNVGDDWSVMTWSLVRTRRDLDNFPAGTECCVQIDVGSASATLYRDDSFDDISPTVLPLLDVLHPELHYMETSEGKRTVRKYVE